MSVPDADKKPPRISKHWSGYGIPIPHECSDHWNTISQIYSAGFIACPQEFENKVLAEIGGSSKLTVRLVQDGRISKSQEIEELRVAQKIGERMGTGKA